MPDACSSRNLVDTRIDAALRETLAGRLQQPVEVSLCVGAELHAPAVAASASIRATWCWRNSASSDTIAASMKTALPANA